MVLVKFINYHNSIVPKKLRGDVENILIFFKIAILLFKVGVNEKAA